MSRGPDAVVPAALALTVNCSILLTHLPLRERPRAVRDAGFDAVELWWPFPTAVPDDADVDAFVASLDDAGVRLTGLNLAAGDMAAGDRGLVSWPGRADELVANLDVVTSIGERTGCRSFNALYGNRQDGVDPRAQDDLAVENLARAADAVGRIGGTVLLEPLSGVAAYPLRTCGDVVGVMDRVADERGARNLGLLLDLYHLAANGVDVADELGRHRDRVAHVQVADAPGRGAPGTGDLPLADWLADVAAGGYAGVVGLEYVSHDPDPFAWLPREQRGRPGTARGAARGPARTRAPLDLVVRARRVLGPDGVVPREVGVRDGVIAAVVPLGHGLAADSVLEVADHEVLLPGLVDTHVHVDEPGRTEWEGFASATRAAASGGVTTIVDMPLNSVPPTTDVAALEVKRAAARGACAVDVAFWGGAVPGNGPHLRALHDAGVLGFKCFTIDSGVPEFGHLDPDGLEAAMRRLVTFDGLLLVHAEDPRVIDAAPAPRGARYADFLASRPPEAESAAIARVVDAARRTGARVHLVHLSSASALPVIAAARADGVRITVETCPHYLALSAEDVPDGATTFKCCPPIRDAANRDALWDALLDGTIDVVVSDHSPSPPELKRLDTGDFGAAWGGISSLGLGLPVVWTHARRRGIPLERVVPWMSSGPARLAGLGRKGSIEVGRDADLVVLDPDASSTVEPARLLHRHPLTPYAGHALTGVVRRTLLRGRDAGDVARGTLLARGDA